MNSIRTSRRRLAFWLGFGLAALGDRTGVSALDDLDALTMGLPENALPANFNPDTGDPIAEHWRAVRNRNWRWYEREHIVDGHWKTTGITTPISIDSGKRILGRTGYIDEQEIPDAILSSKDRKRLGRPLLDTNSWQERLVGPRYFPPTLPGSESVGQTFDPETMPIDFGDRSRSDAGRSSDQRRNRHGRPPSRWLRSLTAEEIRTWLAKVEIQDAHVSGMTFWTHLTRDHLFAPEKISGLTEPELAELHGAAHEGF